MTTDAMVPSYRVQRDSGGGASWRMLAVAAGLLGAVAIGAISWWAVQSLGGPRSIPLVEADPRPFKIRPEDPGGLRVPNQGELILERPAARAQAASHTTLPATVAPEAEAPNLQSLRAAVTPPPLPPSIAPRAPEPAVQAPVAQQPATVAPQPVATRNAAAPAPAPAESGRVVVQLGALSSEEAARAEWARLNRLAPELLQGKSPVIIRFNRGEGQAPLFRLRTGGLPDQDAASQFCEQIRAKRGNCAVVRS